MQAFKEKSAAVFQRENKVAKVKALCVSIQAQQQDVRRDMATLTPSFTGCFDRSSPQSVIDMVGPEGQSDNMYSVKSGRREMFEGLICLSQQLEHAKKAYQAETMELLVKGAGLSKAIKELCEMAFRRSMNIDPEEAVRDEEVLASHQHLVNLINKKLISVRLAKCSLRTYFVLAG